MNYGVSGKMMSRAGKGEHEHIYSKEYHKPNNVQIKIFHDLFDNDAMLCVHFFDIKVFRDMKHVVQVKIIIDSILEKKIFAE